MLILNSKVIVSILLALILLLTTLPNFGQFSETVTYEYDKLNRLTKVIYGSSGAVVIYTYDAAGNRTASQVQGSNNSPSATSLSPNNTTAGTTNFYIDVAGINLVNGAVVEWNGNNRPTLYFGSFVRVRLNNADLVSPGTASVRVVNPAPNGEVTNTLTFTINSAPDPTYTISGEVSYGTTPVGQSTRFVSDVLMTLSGGQTNSVTTSAFGFYQFSNLLAGSYVATPSKSAENGSSAISLQDASLVAQFAFNMATPTANQQIAGDATNNGELSLQDASEIAKKSFNIPGTNIVGAWKFMPASLSYQSLAANAINEDYSAILVGDVTGNWQPPGSFNLLEGLPLNNVFVREEQELKVRQSKSYDYASNYVISPEKQRDAMLAGIPVSLPQNSSGINNTTITLPVTVGDLTGQGITSYEMTVEFNPAVLQPATTPYDTNGTLTPGNYQVFVDPSQPSNRLRIGAFGFVQPLTGIGTLINLKFNVVGNANATSPLTFVNFRFGEGTPQSKTSNGNFTVTVPTAAGVSVGGRVLTSDGRPIRNVIVSMTNESGETQTARTGTFGYYQFDGVTAGRTYVLTVTSKRYRFSEPSVIRTISEDLSGLDFVAEPEGAGEKSTSGMMPPKSTLPRTGQKWRK